MIQFDDWGTISYAEALQKQQAIAAQLMEARKRSDEEQAGRVVFCEHPHVYTLGRNGHAENLLVSRDFLQSMGADIYRSDRGGDITYHGPGQVVCYPVLDLQKLHLALKDYVFLLEEIVIKCLQHYHIEGQRLAGATGVWIAPQTPAARKICAIGIHASHYVSTHGFALNVNTDLRYYSYINPCGFTDKGVSSIAAETGGAVDIEEVKQHLQHYFFEIERFVCQ